MNRTDILWAFVVPLIMGGYLTYTWNVANSPEVICWFATHFDGRSDIQPMNINGENVYLCRLWYNNIPNGFIFQNKTYVSYGGN